MANEEGGGGPQDVPKPSAAELVRTGIPLALAVVVAVLVALGIEGDVRARLIRNAPGSVAVAFVLTMVGVSLPLIFGADSRRRRDTGAIGGVVLLLGAIVTVVIGTKGLSEREQPALTIAPTLIDTEKGMVRTIVTASAPTLRSKDRMMLRVVAVRPRAIDRLSDFCGSPSMFIPSGIQTVVPDVIEPVRIVYWGDTGPTKTGSASSTATVELVNSEFSHICVYAALLNQANEQGAKVAAARVDLRSASAAAK